MNAQHPADQSPPPPFRAAEVTTLSLVAGGLSDLEITQESDLPISVVKAHLRRAQVVSGLRRRSEVAAWAAAHGFAGRSC